MDFKKMQHNIFLFQGYFQNENQEYYLSFRDEDSRMFASECLQELQVLSSNKLVQFLQNEISQKIAWNPYLMNCLVGYFSRYWNKHYIFIQRSWKNNKSIEELKEWVYWNFPTECIYKNPEKELLEEKKEIIQSIIII